MLSGIQDLFDELLRPRPTNQRSKAAFQSRVGNLVVHSLHCSHCSLAKKQGCLAGASAPCHGGRSCKAESIDTDEPSQESSEDERGPRPTLPNPAMLSFAGVHGSSASCACERRGAWSCRWAGEELRGRTRAIRHRKGWRAASAT